MLDVPTGMDAAAAADHRMRATRVLLEIVAKCNAPRSDV